MNMHAKPAKANDTPFFFTEECGLALMLSPRTGRKLAVEMDTWKEVVSGIRRGWKPETCIPSASDA